MRIHVSTLYVRVLDIIYNLWYTIVTIDRTATSVHRDGERFPSYII